MSSPHRLECAETWAGNQRTSSVADLPGLRVWVHSTPFGTVTYRPIDHQSTMGAYVGRLGLKDGKGVMKDWRFVDGKDALPSDDEVKKMRPGN